MADNFEPKPLTDEGVEEVRRRLCLVVDTGDGFCWKRLVGSPHFDRDAANLLATVDHLKAAKK